jgi:hypothetical protein
MHRHGHRNGSRRRVEGALAVMAAASALGGCSWLYDTGELPTYVDPPPPPRPIDQSHLAFTSLFAAPEMEEGYGDGGSRPALLVIEGEDIPRDVLLTITREGDAPIAELALLGPPTVSADYRWIAIPISVAASAALAAGAAIPLLVSISKPDENGALLLQSQPWRLRGRPELTRPTAVVAEGTGKPLIYSKIDVTGALSVSGTEPLVLRSNSTFRITGDFNLNASGQAAGVAGGRRGGDGAKIGAGDGPGVPGASLTVADGGGAGFATQGSGGSQSARSYGDEMITVLEENRSSSGGGGGVLNLLGGAGGGGGGSIELSARGELTVGNISASGGNGASLLNLGDGGGGSGGSIIVRAGAKLTAGTLRAEGGLGGDSTPTSNKGSVGRIRVDTPEVVAGVTSPLAKRGAAFDPATPLIVTQPALPIRLVSAGGTRVDLHQLNADGSPQHGPVDVDFQGASELTVEVTLQQGYNRLCTTPLGSSVSRLESTSCVEVAFIDVDG